MADRPMIFSGPMVCAILDGRKTMTRRVLKLANHPPEFIGGRGMQDDPSCWGWDDSDGGYIVVDNPEKHDKCWSDMRAAYAVGDRLWIREAWQQHPLTNGMRPEERPRIYKATDPEPDLADLQEWERSGRKKFPWQSPMFMPRYASRITLIVEDVRVQRLQEITRGDAMAEGCPFANMADGPDPRDWFADLWDSLNAKRGYGWERNPWVAAITFRPVLKNIDEVAE